MRPVKPLVLLLSSLSNLLSAQPVIAQSLVPNGEWGGSYWGATAGGVWGNLKGANSSAELVWTGFAGYGAQSGAFYLGGELDTTLGGANSLTQLTPALSVSAEVDWSLTGRARLGYALSDGLLLYGTAGIAWSWQRFETAPLVGVATNAEIVRGVVWGGGLEVRLLPIASGRLEALHYDYSGSDTSFSKALRSSLTNAAANGISADETVVRVGLVVRWN